MRSKMKALVTLLLCLASVLALGLMLTACGEADEAGTNPGEVVTPGGEDNPGGSGDTEHVHTPDDEWHFVQGGGHTITNAPSVTNA